MKTTNEQRRELARMIKDKPLPGIEALRRMYTFADALPDVLADLDDAVAEIYVWHCGEGHGHSRQCPWCEAYREMKGEK